MYLRYILVIYILSFGILFHAAAQENADATEVPAHMFKLDFSVPDHPAFNIMGTNPSTLLKPSEALKELSVVTSNYLVNNRITLPQELSLELAPYLLAKGDKITLSDIQQKWWLYNAYLSVGSKRHVLNNNDNRYDVAVGIKVNVFDKGDIRNDPAYLDAITAIGKEQLELANRAEKRFTDSIYHTLPNINTNQELRPGDLKRRNNPRLQQFGISEVQRDTLKQEMDRYVESKLTAYEDIEATIADLQASIKNKNWNARRLDVALAWLATSPDSLANNLQSNRWAGWVTYSEPVGKHGQLLIGFNYTHHLADTLVIENGIARAISQFTSIAIPLRMYLGNNRLKGFSELQYQYHSIHNTQAPLLNLGAEANPFKGIWIEFNVGVEWLHTQLTPSWSNQSFVHFDLRFTIPQGFNL